MSGHPRVVACEGFAQVSNEHCIKSLVWRIGHQHRMREEQIDNQKNQIRLILDILKPTPQSDNDLKLETCESDEECEIPDEMDSQ